MKDPEVKFRHEYKYPISDIEAVVLQERLKGVMSPDIHAGSSGMYNISSLYFDDLYDSCYYENENGTDPREKFRIRTYNNSLDVIRLECKKKRHGKTLKTSTILSREQVENILQGIPLKCDSETDPLLMRFITLQQSNDLKPKVIVEYKRIPYVYKMGNVRVTFDSDLTTSHEVKRFLNGNFLKRPILPSGKLLLEVKFDEFLPDHLYDIMQLNVLTQTAFSKYYLCRRFELNSVRL